MTRTAISPRLATRTLANMGPYGYPIDWQVRRFTEVDSTNRWLADQARAGAPAGLVAVADHQTAGRGRLGRAWVAPPGTSLLLSVLFRPDDLERGERHLLTAVVGLAAADACAEVAGVEAGLKWPNDLVVDDRKLGGLLAEAGDDWVVVGLGLNVAWPPGQLVDGATALNLVGAGVDREALLAAFLGRLDHWYGRWAEVPSAYRARCATLGRLVRVVLAGDEFTGTAADVSDEGHLLVDVGMCLRTVVAGDVLHLRSA